MFTCNSCMHLSKIWVLPAQCACLQAWSQHTHHWRATPWSTQHQNERLVESAAATTNVMLAGTTPTTTAAHHMQTQHK
ncbi:hypothetical protein COO60DRAFT_1474699, partial [Scenedesmus sp. NREL 46B-D3]